LGPKIFGEKMINFRQNLKIFKKLKTKVALSILRELEVLRLRQPAEEKNDYLFNLDIRGRVLLLIINCEETVRHLQYHSTIARRLA